MGSGAARPGGPWLKVIAAFSFHIDAGEAFGADIEVQSSVAAAPARPFVSMLFPPGPSTSYCVTMASPTTSHPFISSEESSEDEFSIAPTIHTMQWHGEGQSKTLPRCQHRPRNTGRARGRARSRSRGMGGRRGRHASLSAAGSSASALGPPSVRCTGVDVPVGAWKRTEPSSICHVYTETLGPTSILVTSDSTPLQISSRFFTDEVWELLVLETNRFAALGLWKYSQSSSLDWCFSAGNESIFRHAHLHGCVQATPIIGQPSFP